MCLNVTSDSYSTELITFLSKLSDIIKINSLSSSHVLLPFSKLQRINCDGVSNVEGV